MANAVVKFGIQKLSTFLGEQGALQQEVQLISDEFGHMKAFLEKMADINQENGDPQLDEWIKQVRDVSYEVQDIVDESLVLLAHHRLPGFLGTIRWTFEATQNLPARRRLSSKLQRVRARINNINAGRLRYESQYANALSQVAGRAAANTAGRNDEAILLEEAEPVGIDKPKQHLVSQLLDGGDSQLRATVLRGMGGLGKTTLARKVHEDGAVKSHFQLRAWVTVSQNWDVHNLLDRLIRQLARQLNQQIPPSMESHEFEALLKDFLHRGRYAIVFDDVRDTEFWDAFKFVLPENSYGGNHVMFTTRMAEVAIASTTDSNGYIYPMELLNFEDSWTLFCKKIFKGNHCPDDMKEVAETIVKTCDGLPLGILAISGLLASKDQNTKKEWELIRDKLCDSSKVGQLKRIFSLSYHDLPSTLKACLLYTSIFPPGEDIKSSYLVQLLVAEGFVEPKAAQTAEDSARDCLKELANRSLIQPYEVMPNGLFNFIIIHEPLREYVSFKSNEQNMVTLISSPGQIRMGCPLRRVVFPRSMLEIPSIEMRKCRSIINFGVKKSPSKAVLAKLLRSKTLTVVDLSGIDSEEIPEEIFKLLQLKFFCIHGKRIRTVPKAIQKLQNLQVLLLIETSVEELPVEILKLHKLHHLELFQVASGPGLARSGFKAPCGMGELVELQTLDAIDAAGMMCDIGKLTRLRKLCITNLKSGDGEELCASLSKLENLHELLLASAVEADGVASFDLNHPIHSSSLKSLCVLELFGSLDNIPPWIRNLRGLRAITLRLSNLAEDPLETLENLPNLFEVRLLAEAYRGEMLCFKAGCYLKLGKLRLENMTGLRRVRIEKSAMPGLSELVMEGLPLLEDLPVGIEHLRQLQQLDLWSMNPKLIRKLEGVDYRKVSHVPQVTTGCNIEGRWECRRLSRKFEESQAQNDHVAPLLGASRNFAMLLFAFVVLCVVLALVLFFTSFLAVVLYFTRFF